MAPVIAALIAAAGPALAGQPRSSGSASADATPAASAELTFTDAPPAPSEKPQLLLFHGGSFLHMDHLFTELSRPRAIRAGFVPHYVDYPLDDLPAAVEYAREEARRYDERYGVDHVYAYGASVGGLFSALLAAEGLVAGAVGKAPPGDLVNWNWVHGQFGPHYYEEIKVTRSQLAAFSPDRHKFESPLLIYQGHLDKIVPPAMDRRFAAKDPRVFYLAVSGGHRTDREHPYLIYKTLAWLDGVADRRIAADE